MLTYSLHVGTRDNADEVLSAAAARNREHAATKVYKVIYLRGAEKTVNEPVGKVLTA